ncbi:MAG TPA: four helix bundle protein [Flexistipes sinusarabici]|uniref:Four helix bundle protein n=1 Tax=Flexistipes sinusarabici TaxID=2352 RepID=A0A3D5QG59_FLESI|nr:four helix bundle protein [Flexistipes sinusarabici]
MQINDVADLKVFKIAHELTLEIYKVTKDFPSEEKFGLISQMRRAASSICANMMEGSYRNNSKEFRQFCGIARGSVGELRYFIILSEGLGYISKDMSTKLIEKTATVSKMIYGLIKSLENK